MNPASLFNLAGPDLFLILLLVLGLAAGRLWPRTLGEWDESEDLPESERRRLIVNRVLAMFAVIAVVILLNLVWSRL